MNQKQRGILLKCAQQLEQIECEVSNIVVTIEDVKSSEEDKLNNLPDSLRYSQMGESIEEGVDKLDEILEYIDNREFSDAASLLEDF